MQSRGSCCGYLSLCLNLGWLYTRCVISFWLFNILWIFSGLCSLWFVSCLFCLVFIDLWGLCLSPNSVLWHSSSVSLLTGHFIATNFNFSYCCTVLWFPEVIHSFTHIQYIFHDLNWVNYLLQSTDLMIPVVIALPASTTSLSICSHVHIYLPGTFFWLLISCWDFFIWLWEFGIDFWSTLLRFL